MGGWVDGWMVDGWMGGWCGHLSPVELEAGAIRTKSANVVA